jgi:hypothetical protein
LVAIAGDCQVAFIFAPVEIPGKVYLVTWSKKFKHGNYYTVPENPG